MNSQDYSQRMENARRKAHREWAPDHSQTSPATLTPLTDLNSLGEQVADVRSRQVVSERPFSSNLPILGRLIVRVRSVWNWMSTKWYVHPLIWQQSMINARLSMIICEMAQWQEINVLHLAELQARIDELEARLVERERQ